MAKAKASARQCFSKPNVKVFSELCGSDIAPLYIKFEVARHQHTEAKHAPYTVTVMFKDPAQYLHAEAWRTLREVTKGEELLPEHVQKYMEQSIDGASRV